MGQDITCLITNENIELDKSIVHFSIKQLTFIPFNTSCDLGIEEAKNFDLLSDYILHLESKDSFDHYLYNRDNDHCDMDIFKIVKDYRIESFIIEHSYDWADMLVEYYFMQVQDGRILKNSLVYDDSERSKSNKANIQEAKKNLGLHFNWLDRTDLFYSYYHADRAYTLQHAK
ncbi:hypothetical protein SAMN05421866_2606 [Chryseobacterium oranimense]|uniref:Uncharacterized protein n=1 Tax=Chryseobacterium oranimense TaxID=421058 RepID=A0A1M5S2E8_9FLAO|nr:hypothetical protein [Chryseobacterium oranimense]SHH32458.1 hypothetical protein SAMN05421866_2606 [Chryseobacterium oranimense]